MKSVIKSVLDGDWNDLQGRYEKLAADKVMEKIADKKVDVLAMLNGVEKEKMQDMVNVSDEEE